MKKQYSIFIIVLIFVVIPFISNGQKGYEDVIYLKSGGIIYGTITENVPDKYVTIKTDDGNILTNNWGEIYKITKAQSGKNKRNDTVFPVNGASRSGYLNVAELKGGLTFPSWAFGICDINAYRVSPEFSIGVGVGFDYGDSLSLAFVPIFADFRFYTLGKKNGVVVFDIGESSCLNTGFVGGLMITLSLNKRIPVSKKTSIIIGVGYTSQYDKDYNPNIFYAPRIEGQVNYLRLNFGFSFE